MLDWAGTQEHADVKVSLAAGVTDRGIRHQRNEDAIALATVDGPNGPVALAVVSDGVSSSPRPDEASLAAVRAAIEVLSQAVQAGDALPEASQEAVRAAAAALASLAGTAGHDDVERTAGSGESPAATYVSAALEQETVTVCWLGDSRVYWLTPDPAQCMQLTRDDSLAEELVAAGVATPEEAMATPQAHVITRWLGADMPDPQPHVREFRPPGPGVILACSDGLWNYSPDAADLGVLVPFPGALSDPLAAAQSLVKFAVNAGGVDNVTVALIPFSPASLTAGPVAALRWPRGRRAVARFW